MMHRDTSLEHSVHPEELVEFKACGTTHGGIIQQSAIRTFPSCSQTTPELVAAPWEFECNCTKGTGNPTKECIGGGQNDHGYS